MHDSGLLYVYYRDVRIGGAREEREGGGREWFKGEEVVSKFSFHFFLLNHSTVCSIKVKPIER